MGSIYGGSLDLEMLKNKKTMPLHTIKSLISLFFHRAIMLRGMNIDQGNIPPKRTGKK
jgi:hypothetical protein